MQPSPNMNMPGRVPTPTATRFRALVEGINLDVRSTDRCWTFTIKYSCGCRYREQGCGYIYTKKIRVKKDNHSGSCTLHRCLKGSESHYLTEKCVHCSAYDAMVESMTVSS
ncbi:hypothetical protein F4808DRAFT_424875 [Astrocystis sublimbata]|nr:hypothetical protein F4808DRAFT_424875 [Astrocystis sublimbata]